MASDILSKIKAFPPLDESIMKIQEICMDHNSSIKNLVDVVEQDPMLTANILKSANSPLYGFSREIKNINQAISLFGMATIRGFALSSAIKHNIKIDLTPYGMNSHGFMELSSMQSSLMLNWYRKVDSKMIDILIPASFLMEIGKIIVAHEINEQGKASAFADAYAKVSLPLEVSTLEKEFTDYTNEEVTSKIFEMWNLEREIVEAIKYSNNPKEADADIIPYATALQIVKLAINTKEKITDNSLANANKALAENGMDAGVFAQAVEKIGV
jgi:HD-like signal output (HDOD) protein